MGTCRRRNGDCTWAQWLYHNVYAIVEEVAEVVVGSLELVAGGLVGIGGAGLRAAVQKVTRAELGVARQLEQDAIHDILLAASHATEAAARLVLPLHSRLVHVVDDGHARALR